MSAHESEEAMPSHYEKTQLRGRPFVVGAICFFVFCFFMFVADWKLLQNWSSQTQPPHHAPTPPAENPRWDVQAPQVQFNPELDLAKVRQTEDRRLHALRWNDSAHTHATIPIQDAMQLLANAAAKGQLTTVLPAPIPATPLELQDQKSRETSPPQVPNP